MKTLFLGDYSNLHACLASRLRKEGHDVTVVSDGGRFMDTQKDILLCRASGKTGMVRYLADLVKALPAMRGYDVVQLINPHFLSLKPARLKWILEYLRKYNGRIFLSLAGNDWKFVDTCMNSDTFAFSEFRVGESLTEFEKATGYGAGWLRPGMKEYSDMVYELVDGAMSVLPEYDMAARPLLGDRLAFTNIPVDLSSLPYKELSDTQGPVRFFIGIKSEGILKKGTGRLLEICRRLEKEMPGQCSVTTVSDLSLKEYLKRMGEGQVVLDQLYSYSPGTNGFQAMALGRVAATGAQPEFYRYLNATEEKENLPVTYWQALSPIVPLSPLADTEAQLRTLMEHKERLPGMARAGRLMVERHNDVAVVARRFLNHWQKF